MEGQKHIWETHLLSYGQPQKPGLLSGASEGCISDVKGFQIHLQNMRVLVQITA